MGIGGIVYVFTSFQLGNLFQNSRSTVIAVMIGSYNASSIVYTVFLMLYEVGIPFWGLMAIHGGLNIVSFIAGIVLSDP